MAGGRRVWAVRAVGLLAYVIAVLHRTSFGVTGLEAAKRFDATPASLAGFVVLQMLVYGALQVPGGMLIDRLGPRRVLIIGGLVMAAGQAVLAAAAGLPLAITGRVLVGAGDAVTFISVLRLVSGWFQSRRVPLLTQLTGIIGQFGQILSAVPLAAVLYSAGWAVAFGSAAAVGMLAVVLVIAVAQDPPIAEPPEVPTTMLQGLHHAWSERGTRLGMWTHIGTQFSMNAFALLWGVPYLVAGQGFSPGEAGALLTLFVLCGIVVGPLFGEFIARHPLRRSSLVLVVIGLTAAAWTAVLAPAPPAPRWLIVVLVVVLSLGGPGSVIGFDYARTFNPEHRQGSAVGLVNMSGFLVALLVALAVGLVLDAAGGYTPEAFRVAWMVQYPVWAVAAFGVWSTRQRTRRELAAQGTVVTPIRDLIARRRNRSES